MPIVMRHHGPVNGNLWYLWLFATAQFVFLTIQNSRTRKVLTKHFGNFFDGVIISDCLRVYEQFAQAFEKDWTHLLRKTHFEAEKIPEEKCDKVA